MAVKVRIIDERRGKPGKPKFHDFRIKDWDELTLNDYRTLTDFPSIEKKDWTELDEMAFNLDAIHRHTKIPKSLLEDVATDTMQLLIDGIGSLLEKAMEEAGKKYEGYTPPKVIKHRGKTYMVPHDLERETVWKQWKEIEMRETFAHQADVYLHFLSMLLIEKGKKFSPDDVPAKDEAFGDMKMIDVFPLVAFFFSGNERFRNAMSRSSSRYVGSIRLRVRQALTRSSDDGEPIRSEPSDLPASSR